MVSREARIIALRSPSEDSHNVSFAQCPSKDRFCVLAQSLTNGRPERARMAVGSLAEPDRGSGSARLAGAFCDGHIRGVPFRRTGYGRETFEKKQACCHNNHKETLAGSLHVGTCTSREPRGEPRLHFKARRRRSRTATFIPLLRIRAGDPQPRATRTWCRLHT